MNHVSSVPSRNKEAVRARVVRTLFYEAAIAEVATALEAQSVPVLLLKGAAFARWLYPDPNDRSYGDIDLLVDPQRLGSAERVMAELHFVRRGDGSRPSEVAQHHSVWDRPGHIVVTVEIHHTLSWLPDVGPLLWRRLISDASEMTIARKRVAVPSEEASAMIVCLHASQHGVARAKSMRDLELAVERVQQQTWGRAALLAGELGALDAFAAGLQLDEAGAAISTELGLVSDSRRVVRLKASSPPKTAMGIERLASAGGTRPRLRIIAEELAPSVAFMRGEYRLARRGPGGLSLAYLLRPFRLAVALPRGLAVWRRIAAEHRRGR